MELVFLYVERHFGSHGSTQAGTSVPLLLCSHACILPQRCVDQQQAALWQCTRFISALAGNGAGPLCDRFHKHCAAGNAFSFPVSYTLQLVVFTKSEQQVFLVLPAHLPWIW